MVSKNMNTLDDEIRNIEMRELQEDILGLVIQFKKDYSVNVKESTLFSETCLYLNTRIKHSSFRRQEINAWNYLKEKYKVNGGYENGKEE